MAAAVAVVVPAAVADLIDVFDVPKAPTATATRPVEISNGPGL
jgi:hypothetical protein